MIKGVNRHVVEFSQPECEYFERIVFFVKPEYASVSEGRLRERARLIASGAGAPPPSKIAKNRVMICLKYACAAVVGAAASAGIIMIF